MLWRKETSKNVEGRPLESNRNNAEIPRRRFLPCAHLISAFRRFGVGKFIATRFSSLTF